MAERRQRRQAGPKAPTVPRQERALALARDRYELHRTGNAPYAVHGSSRWEFDGPGRTHLAADLRGAWREANPGEPPPADGQLRTVLDDLRHLAMRAEPDPDAPPDEAAALLAEHIGSNPADPYDVIGGCLVWHRPTVSGDMDTTLATFDAEIAEEVTLDDGSGDVALTWLIRVVAADGRAGEVRITPDQLGRPQQWAAKAAGTSALVMPGMAIADHVRVAVHSRSRSIARRTVFTHTGWRRIGGRWAYLTSSGAMGAGGLDTSVSVDLGPLSSYCLPEVPGVRDVRGFLRAALQASLALVDIAPDQVSIPLLAAVWRAPLPLLPDCSVWVYGRSGTFKSAITALGQQHFGPQMDAWNLPGNWTSTANALEHRAHSLASALLVIDDYSPDLSKADAQRRAATAERLLRGSANRAGRGRLRPDGTERPDKPPRAQILTSAEDMPPAVESLLARVLVAEVTPGDVQLGALSEAQGLAGDGTFAMTMAGYISYFAGRYDSNPELPATLAQARDTLRDQARSSGQHPRTALNIATLALGWRQFLGFAVASGAITTAGRDELWQRAQKALHDLGADQERFRRDSDPIRVYLRSVLALIASGRAHLAARDNSPPGDPSRWGWTDDNAGRESADWTPEMTPRWRPQGDRLGWIDDDGVYLEPEAAYRAARLFAESSGVALGVTKTALHKNLKERNLIASSQPGHITAKCRVAGATRDVVHLTVQAFETAAFQ